MGMPEILDRVAEETEMYLEAGVDGLVLENMHDTPYCLEQQLGPHIGACMAVVAKQVILLLQQIDTRFSRGFLFITNNQTNELVQRALLRQGNSEYFNVDVMKCSLKPFSAGLFKQLIYMLQFN